MTATTEDGYSALRKAVWRVYFEMLVPSAGSTCLWCGGPHGTAKAHEQGTFYEHEPTCAWMNLIEVARMNP